MKIETEIEKLNAIIEKSKKEKYTPIDFTKAFDRISGKTYDIYLEGDSYFTFYKIVEEIFKQYVQKKNKLVSYNAFRSYIRTEMYEVINEKGVLSKDKILRVIELVSSMEAEEFCISSCLNHITIQKKPMEIIEHGSFKFASYARYRKDNEGEIPLLNRTLNPEQESRKELNSTVISVNVTACDEHMATRLALRKIEEFENLLLTVLNPLLFNDIKARNNAFFSNHETEVLILSKTIKRHKIEPNYYLSDLIIDIDNDFFSNSSLFKNSLAVLKKEDRNDMEISIVNSLEWVGQSRVVNDKNKKVLYLMIALESILAFEEEYFNQSIVQRISECVAFILGKDLEERKDYYKKTKQLYKLRSSVAHFGSKDEIETEAIYQLDVMAKNVLDFFVSTEEGRSIKDRDSLREYILQHRFTYE